MTMHRLKYRVFDLSINDGGGHEVGEDWPLLAGYVEAATKVSATRKLAKLVRGTAAGSRVYHRGDMAGLQLLEVDGHAVECAPTTIVRFRDTRFPARRDEGDDA
jgi:hypothetical protein